MTDYSTNITAHNTSIIGSDDLKNNIYGIDEGDYNDTILSLTYSNSSK